MSVNISARPEGILLGQANTWTQPQLFAVGTVAAPSMTFSGDTDTGIYNVGANILGISVGGALVASFQTGLIGFVNGASLASAAADGATLLLVARNAAAATQTVLTVVGAATVANSYITAQVGGTWTLAAGQTWTLPAVTFSGILTMGANNLSCTVIVNNDTANDKFVMNGGNGIEVSTRDATNSAPVLRMFLSRSSAQGSGRIMFYEQIRIGADSTNNAFWTATQGAASTTMYIGNASINVTSDRRVKDNLRPFTGDAVRLLEHLSVVEFDYKEEYRPFGGGVYEDRYVGMTAQELFKLAPWTVNTQGGKDCRKCLNGEPCNDHLPWQVNYGLLSGLLVKAIQGLNQRLERLELK